MNYVQPIRDQHLVRDIGSYIKNNSERNYVMYLCGIYTGLRISDILKLRIADVKDKTYINIREKKTGKQKVVEINPILKKEIKFYLEDKADSEQYLIQSREGYNQPLSRSMAYKILREAGERFGLEGIGTHTLRKTFGYHFYKQTKDVVTLQAIFNHSHPSVTLRYIGINQETANIAIRKFKIY